MLIKYVKLENFRQFYGEQTVEFSTDKSNNVTLIHAENGVGKTALLNAIKWCLFEQFTENFVNPKDLLNHHASTINKNSTVSVEVGFITSDNKEYRAKRLEKGGLQVYPLEGGIPLDRLKEPKTFINTVLPPEMSNYFFFQGEGSSALKKGKASSTRDAIRDILGFRPALQAISDLEEISEGYFKEMRKLDNKGEISDINKKVEETIQLLKDSEKKLVNIDVTIEKCESDIAKIDEELGNLDSKAIEVLTRDRKINEDQIKTLKTKIKQADKNKSSLVGKFGWSIFGKDIADTIYDYIDESQIKGRLPEPYNKSLIDEILKTKECICGNSIEKGTDARLKIESLISKAVDPQLQSRVFNVKAWTQRLNDTFKLAENEIKTALQIESSYISDLEALERKKLEFDRAFEGLEGDSETIVDKAKVLNLARKSKEKTLRYNLTLKGTTTAQIENIIGRLKKYKIQQGSLSNNDSAVGMLLSQQQAANILIENIKNILEKTESEARTILYKLVNDNIESFLRNSFKVKLDSDFNVSLINENNKQVNLSDGQRLLLNLIFTASLIKHAENRLNAKSGVLLPGTTAPFVIDAPFGELDKTYRGHVAKMLPNYARQVVLFLSSSHWEGEVESNIRSAIGKEYYIKLHESSSIGKKKLDKINVLGVDYVLNAYDAEHAYSEIVDMEKNHA
ncbi:AAA family ATPase [Vibrio breoganii]|uniref:AAA family ATPase n=1 Tax=Vibrio breoganii TaxID=553239 RepID=UPI000C8408B3|nr:AAA family ATPase [Vibrio breoganii]PMH18201.1 hypothetical protein BCU74_09525 [Vibrio breoganii]PMM17596.1 hypothetical protein BCT60_03680 [Vibrio breoganii]